MSTSIAESISTSTSIPIPTASITSVPLAPTPATVSISASASASISVPSAETSKLTNGQRMARGLPLLPPSRRITGLKPKRSSVPTSSTPPVYVIRLRNPADGSEYGVISRSPEDNKNGDLVDVAPDMTQAMKFAFGPDGKAQEGPFDIYPSVTDQSISYANMGWSTYDNDGLLHINLKLNHLLASSISSTEEIINPVLAPLTTGSPDEAHSLPAQGAMWTYDRQSRRLLAHYRNVDGSIIPTKFTTGGDCQHTICLVADIEAFQNDLGADAIELHLLATVDV
ncbi:hypothetical protein BCR39DRAFT_508138 [Naematelia encephala]|uniref:Uncharacterized protein n=1 Tax=Naematelia encephala TaxID=71784 RepID=A0A1Y2AII4_9TREE|nr:hypothetical protein BCR39DRAFT_508138 [Naematelia encephala]